MDLSALNRAGKVYTAANTAAKNHIAVTTSMTGLILVNPPGSGKNLIIADFGFVWTTAPAAVHNLGLALTMQGIVALSGINAIGSGVLKADGSGNAAGSVTKAYDAAVVATAPVIQRWVGGAAYGSGVGESAYQILDHIDGALIVVPGAILTTAAVTTTLAGMAHITWFEVPA